jgi:hypothetical protein
MHFVIASLAEITTAGIRRSCRWFLFSFSTLVLATGVSASQSPFSLKIAEPTGPQKSGSELRLRITVTNTSDREITFITTPGQVPEDDFQYELMVRDERGQSAPPSAFMRTRDPRLPMYSGSRIGKSVRPSESFVDEVNVTRFFDLSRPGKYTISVARPNPPRQNLGDGKVQSNSVTVTVVAAVLDLTAQVPSDEQGYYPGLLPAGSGGGATGGWHPGPHDTEFYRLPLTLEILRTTTRDDGALVFEILLRNDGPLPFDLPTSQNLTKIENPANKSRHVFFSSTAACRRRQERFRRLGISGDGKFPQHSRFLTPHRARRDVESSTSRRDRTDQTIHRECIRKITDQGDVQRVDIGRQPVFPARRIRRTRFRECIRLCPARWKANARSALMLPTLQTTRDGRKHLAPPSMKLPSQSGYGESGRTMRMRWSKKVA